MITVYRKIPIKERIVDVIVRARCVNRDIAYIELNDAEYAELKAESCGHDVFMMDDVKIVANRKKV